MRNEAHQEAVKRSRTSRRLKVTRMRTLSAATSPAPFSRTLSRPLWANPTVPTNPDMLARCMSRISGTCKISCCSQGKDQRNVVSFPEVYMSEVVMLGHLALLAGMHRCLCAKNQDACCFMLSCFGIRGTSFLPCS